MIYLGSFYFTLGYLIRKESVYIFLVLFVPLFLTYFIKEKETYIKSIYDNLKPGGFLILTEKTKNSGIELELYHQFKRNQGVSDEEISKKSESLIGKMFINSEFWYFKICKEIGFKEPAKCMSGNGYQLWFAIPEIKITEENDCCRIQSSSGKNS